MPVTVPTTLIPVPDPGSGPSCIVKVDDIYCVPYMFIILKLM